MKWTLVRYEAKPERADENQRLSAAVFDELQTRRRPGCATPCSGCPTTRSSISRLGGRRRRRCPALETLPRLPEGYPRALRRAAASRPQPIIVGNYGMLAADKVN